MLDRFAQLLEKDQLMPAGESYIVAVSGGVDSMVLLDLLTQLSEGWGWNLIVAHVDHAQRPESMDDAMFVSQAADRAGHRFLLHRLRPGSGSENRLRNARHAWLEDMRQQYGARSIVTAHHLNDRLETAVWHAIRGSDRLGLTSLSQKSQNLIRPLIRFSRGEILTHAQLRDLAWREDRTNADRSYTRNLIRHELLHEAPTLDPHYHNNLSGWLDHLEVVNARIDSRLDHLSEKISTLKEYERSIKLSSFLSFSPAIQSGLLTYWARQWTGGTGLTQANVLTALDWIASAPTGTYTEALPGLILIREYDKVSLVPRSAPVESLAPEGAVPLVLHEPVRYGHLRLTLVPADDHPDDIPLMTSGSYLVRSWQSGDRIQPVGMQGSKKVQDIFVDQKIPRRQRHTWPLVVTPQNDIALIPRLARDRRFASSEHHTAVKLHVEEVD